jgi:transcriptional regulator with XRE-family HTH domain
MTNSLKPAEAIRRRDVAYYRRRQQNRVYTALTKFIEAEVRAGRISRKEIADKLSKNPSQISRWLSGPSNFELDTLSDLLLAMGAEMDHSIVRFADRPRGNYMHPLLSATVSNAAISPQKRPAPPKPPIQTNKHTGSTTAATVVIE